MNSIFILGATSDIGRELSYIYAGKGYSLILSARDKSDLTALKQDVKVRFDVDAETVSLDLQDFENIDDVISSFKGQICGFVLMAGYLGDQQLAQSSKDEAYKIMAVNYTGSCAALESAAKNLESVPKSFIIGVSSVAGLRGRQSNYMYGSAKAGLISYLSGLRNRLQKSDTTVLTVLPGFVDTKMTAHLELPALLTASPAKVAADIVKGQTRGKSVVYSIFVWRYIMWIIRCIPEFVFKRLSL
ncbi:MAG: SDR family oxidoreductase [Candidatus Cloacimonetes bacterium]|nr:SDR family oxidoreductase [Candidatus Cloacimonadota bacterium]